MFHAIQSASTSATQLYLHVAAVDWVFTQAIEEEIVMSTMLSMFPQHGVLAESGPKAQTVLDAYISLATSSFSPSSLDSIILALTETCSTFRTDTIPKFYVNEEYGIGSLSLRLAPLVESGLLKRWHQPRLGLRLLAPLMLSNTGYESPKIKMLASECLLVEASYLSKNKLADEKRTHILRKRASDLYEAANEDYDNFFHVYGDTDADVDTVFYILTKNVNDWCNCANIPDGSSHKEDLSEEVLSRLSILMTSNDSAVPPDNFMFYPIQRLAKVTSCKALILSWITAEFDAKTKGQNPYLPFLDDENPKLHIRLFFHKLRTAAHRLDRLALIERHTTDHKLLLECVDDALLALNSELPRDMVYDMTESATLWSAMFQHAMAISEWQKALIACRNNPLASRKKAGLRRLVVGMVESGALGDLLVLANPPMNTNCFQNVEVDFGADFDKGSTTSSIDQFDDFYETAVSILTEQAKAQTKRGQYAIRNGTKMCDFRCCLYALHASRGDWRRASGAMNDRFESMFVDQQNNALIGDLSLSALACANSIQLEVEK